jgi:hypothetical protein
MDLEKLPEDHKTVMERICEDRLIYCGTLMNFKMIKDCQIVEIEEILYEQISGIMVWKGFPYKDVMTRL